MRRAWAALLLAAWAGAAVGARGPISAQERERIVALEKAGAAGDEAVLAEQVKARDRWGVEYWVRGYRQGSHGAAIEVPLPESLEALIVAHFADPVIGGRLANIVRRGTYSSHRLFVLLNTLTRDRLATQQPVKGFDAAAELVVRTKLPGIEEPLMRLVERYCALGSPGLERQRNFAQCFALEEFLARRRHEPARTWIAAQVAASPAQSHEVDALLGILVAFGDREAAEVLAGLLEDAVADPSARDAQARAVAILWKFQLLDHSVPIDYGRLRRALKAMPTGALAEPAVSLLRKRKEPAGAGVLVEALAVAPSDRWAPGSQGCGFAEMSSTEFAQRVLDELLVAKRAAMLKPAQEAVLARCEELLRKAERQAEGRTKLEEWVRRNEAEAAAREAARRREEERRAPLVEARRIAAQQPVEASRHYRRFIEALLRDARFRGNGGDVQAVRQEISGVVDEAVRHDRYVRRDPRAAIDVLRLSLGEPSPTDPREHDFRVSRRVLIADILHFDLGDREAAAREFDAAAAIVRASPRDYVGVDAAANRGMIEWLALEAAYLRQGKVLRGAASEALRAALGLAAVFGRQPALAEIERSLESAPGRADPGLRAKALSILQGLPPSRANMDGILRWLGAFPDEASLRRFLERHDPAGARTIVTLTALAQAERAGACEGSEARSFLPWICDDRAQPHPVIAAARGILASRGVPEPPAADARLSTPQGTWSVFVGALRAGDRQAALACMTPELQERYREAFRSLDAARLRAMAEEFSPLSMGKSMEPFQEAFVTRDRGGKQQAAIVYFLRQGREWRISEM